MHTLVHQLNCKFWRSFEGALANVRLPDASFTEDKAEGSRRRIKQTRSFILVPPYNSDAKGETGDASDVYLVDSDASVPENDDLKFGVEYEIEEE
jgi:hypothetical protein